MSAITRRDFMKVSGSALAALGVNGLAVKGASAAGPYGELRMGLQSYSLRNFSFADAMQRISKLGLGHVELFPGHLDHNAVTKSQLSDAQKLMADLGIVPDAYGVVGFDKNEKAARKVFEFAQTLGLRSISSDPKPDSFDMLDGLVEEYKIPIAIHNHGPHHHWGHPEVILKAVKDHNPLIGLCADTGHFLRAGEDPVKAIRMLKGRVFGLHVKDFISEKEEVVAGDGNLNLAALFSETRKQHFDGACSMEYELTPEDPTDGLRAGLSNIRQAIVDIG
jgi:inosose dehydratase